MAVPGNTVNLAIFLGEDKTLQDIIYQPDGVTKQDITGWTWTFAVHMYGDPTQILIQKAGLTSTDPTHGVLNIQLLRLDTVNADGSAKIPPGEYGYYIVRTDSSNWTEPTQGLFTILTP